MPVYQGALSPEGLQILVGPLAGVDLTLVTSATVLLKNPQGSSVTWTGWTLSNQTSSGVTLTHLFQPGDVDQGTPSIGTWVAVVKLTVTGFVNPIRCVPVQFPVQDQFLA